MDKISAEQRSENMRKIRSRDTKPEIVVRNMLRILGHSGYRLHRSDLPGKPDLAYIGRKKAIFIHGCFWHGHDCVAGVRKPKSNVEYWSTKISRNKSRDIENLHKLQELQWSVLVIWECELRDRKKVEQTLLTFMNL